MCAEQTFEFICAFEEVAGKQVRPSVTSPITYVWRSKANANQEICQTPSDHRRTVPFPFNEKDWQKASRQRNAMGLSCDYNFIFHSSEQLHRQSSDECLTENCFHVNKI